MKILNIIVSCECSGIVRDAFIRRGHNAVSCDLKETETEGPHLIMDNDMHLKDTLYSGKWDMMIGHPPCTYLTVTANKWLKEQPKRKSGALVGKERLQARYEAIKFAEMMWKAPIKRICLENPIGVLSTESELGEPTQIIQPYYFGDAARKTTCLWLKNLPKLFHAKEVDLFNSTITHVDQGEIITTKSGNKLPKWYAYADKSKGQDHRASLRSKTFNGFAEAMANQWSNLQ